ncbi:MAG: hypothetical protein Hyperionvirus53_5 [Hyperionvirus sp.]|uniref:Uncharacterized protein n=1 Tax=Hyperionvirus sp. TaxID=2487770 RepID=A0A3G5ACL6_9VIRU|nr:MAG: hypothetical protein Hyperionvirus53_5 [Hyperionvirus sp.]
MDYQVFLAYVVLALVIAVIIQLLFKAFSHCHRYNKPKHSKNPPKKSENFTPDDIISNAQIPNNLISTDDDTPSGYTSWKDDDSYARIQNRKYQNDFFGFRSHLWNRSDGGTDPIDRINTLEPVLDEQISDVYNSLTQNNKN